MRKTVLQPESNIPLDLKSLYLRLEVNAKDFGMSPTELNLIKKECRIAFRHKLILEKVQRKKN